MKVLIIIPAFNEGKNIETVINNIKKKCNHYNFISAPIKLEIKCCVQLGK